MYLDNQSERFKRYLELFELTPHFTYSELRKAYRRLARKTHSDKVHGSDLPMVMVNDAYEYLKNLLEDRPYKDFRLVDYPGKICTKNITVAII
jgi:curved DNA-binding protein CbpA